MEQDDHEISVEFNKKLTMLKTKIAGMEDLLVTQVGGGTPRSTPGHLMFEKLKLPELKHGGLE